MYLIVKFWGLWTGGAWVVAWNIHTYFHRAAEGGPKKILAAEGGPKKFFDPFSTVFRMTPLT